MVNHIMNQEVRRYQGAVFGENPFVMPLVTELVLMRSRTHGSKSFVTAVSAKGAEETLTYSGLCILSDRLATWFMIEIGARPGSIVAVLPTNDIRSVLCIFALLRSGCTILLLNPLDPYDRLRQQTEHAAALGVFCAPGIAENIFPGVRVVPDPLNLPEPLTTACISVSCDSDAFLIGTSGSTATSKLVAQTHVNAAANAQAVVRHHNLTIKDRFLGCLPIHHVNGLHFTIFGVLAAGAHAILAYGFDPLRYPCWIEYYRPRIASVVPSILEALLETWRGSEPYDDFEYFVSAAAPLTATTARGVAARLRRRVIQGYGLTETTNFSCSLPPEISNETYRKLILDADIPTIGVAVYGNEVAVLGLDGKRVPPGDTGEICMRGFNVMSRYAGNEVATVEAFQYDWFHSQDIGMEVQDLESKQTLFLVTGRLKNVAKIRGESVSIDEIDRVLRALPGIRDAACVAQPHRLYGEEIVAAVVVETQISDAEIREHLSRHLSSAAQPAMIVRRSEIPKTLTGKILRMQLAAELLKHVSS